MRRTPSGLNAIMCMAVLLASLSLTAGFLIPIPQHSTMQAGLSPLRSALQHQRPGVRTRTASKLRAGFLDALFGDKSEEEDTSQAPVKVLAPGWTEAVDPESGATYWYNAETEEASWEKPLVDSPGGAGNVDVAQVQAEYPMPALYDGWFSRKWTYIGSDGETERTVGGTGQIEAQMLAAVAAAEAAGVRRMEVTFPPVPNLDEVDFGTALNLQFSFEVREDLGLTSKDLKSAVRRNLVDFSNQHWATKLAQGMATGRRVSIQHCDQTSKRDCTPLDNISVSRTGTAAPLGEDDVLVIVNPGPADQWESAAKPAKAGNTLVYLNSISGGWTYELGGPDKDAEQVYYLRRISKGWVFRCYPGPWQALVELPDGSVQVLKTYSKRPKLREVSGLVRNYSFDKFSIFNDRYAQGFGARL